MDSSVRENILELLSDEYTKEHEDALEQAAECLEKTWSKTVFYRKLYQIFSPDKLQDTEVQEILCKEAVTVLPELFGQGIVLTTNYDHVLEDAYRRYGKGIQACDVLHQERLNMKLRSILSGAVLIKLHGDVEEPETSIVLNSESYEEAYQEGSVLIKTLQKCYGAKAMLF